MAKTRKTPKLRSKPSTAARVAAVARGRAKGAVAVLSRTMAGGQDTDPIALLEADHRQLEELLKQGEQTTERGVKVRTKLLDTLTTALERHEHLEEQLLYPALKPHAEARDLVLEGYQEHHVADVIVRELHRLAKDDERWGAKLKVLQENLEHHIEEEESQMFPIARAVLDGEELEGLGTRMKTLKRRLK